MQIPWAGETRLTAPREFYIPVATAAPVTRITTILPSD
jgi:hypothetical protein